MSYLAEWASDKYLPPQIFTLRLDAGQPISFSCYPKDPSLPGLEEAAQPDTAMRLLNEHVFAIPRRKLRVEMVRYRPGSRAVLRHRSGNIRLYVRVIRPSTLPNLLAAAELIGHTGFAVPRVVGSWSEGGVVWLTEIPGKNLRKLIRRGKPPDTTAVLDGLESLWASPFDSEARAFDLASAYRRAKRSFRHALRDLAPARNLLDAVTKVLDPFALSWQPSAIAHNDFYDDQMLVLPDGRVAVVDLEDAGRGDPLLDVGNFLAHLKWASSFGNSRRGDASGAYYHQFRSAALSRFRWDRREFDLRETICLFRISTNVIRRPTLDWHDRIRFSLSLISDQLG